jgi:hypothetical protein
MRDARWRLFDAVLVFGSFFVDRQNRICNVNEYLMNLPSVFACKVSLISPE